MSLTPQQEKFACAVASGKNQSDAYREAFKVRKTTKPSSVNVNASKLMADAKIAQRVQELRRPIVEEARLTLSDHLYDLKRLRDLAEASNQMSAAITAEAHRGKAAGLYTEKVEMNVNLKHHEVLIKARERIRG